MLNARTVKDWLLKEPFRWGGQCTAGHVLRSIQLTGSFLKRDSSALLPLVKEVVQFPSVQARWVTVKNTLFVNFLSTDCNDCPFAWFFESSAEKDLW